MEQKQDIFLGIKTAVQRQKESLVSLQGYVIKLEKAKTHSEKINLEKQIADEKRKIVNQNEKAMELVKSLNLVSKLIAVGYNPAKSEEEKERDDDEGKNYADKDSPLRSDGGQIVPQRELFLRGLEKETVRRLREKEKKDSVQKKPVKQDNFAKIASILFSSFSKNLLGRESFKKMEKDLVKANLNYSPTGYVSSIILTTLVAFIIGGFVFLFFMFFNVGSTLPMITRATESINIRFLKTFWILIAIPLVTFLVMYFYPNLEKKAVGARIDEELPFATIHMSAISGSMIDPIRIFEIIASTGEYPALQKEFTKLLNEINLYGSDFVNALKNSGRNTSSKKLGELYNGLSTNINSGGDLPMFFEKRSETLLFEHQIAIQKSGKAAETFMDVYISVVIAAPMILMILLMMMKLSGIGLSLSVGMITLIMILIVAGINAIFLTFLHMKKKK
jgi:hypothetical protein